MASDRRLQLAAIAVSLISMLGIAIIVRYPLLYYNLPVAANVDERTGLALLHRLERVSFNPEFFHYPTFYYYLTFFFTRPFDNLLVAGRLLNVLFGCGLALALFVLAQRTFVGTVGALLAAALTLFSPILLMNGSYIITDVLMTLFVLCALLAFGHYFSEGSKRAWFAGVLCAGLAIATKYSAAIIVPAYLLMEYLTNGPSVNAKQESRRLPRPLFLALLAVAAVLLLALGWLLPATFFQTILQAGANVDSTIDSSDMAFIGRMRQLAILGGLGLLLILPLLYFKRRWYERFSRYRPVVAIILIALVFFAGTPYALISWHQFLYDFGYELKTNQVGTARYWQQYVIWYARRESLIALLLAGFGLIYAVRRARERASSPGGRFYLGLILAYALLYALSIGIAKRGYPRYLTPLLPIIFLFAGAGITWLLNITERLKQGWQLKVFIIVIVLSVAAVELQPNVAAFVHQADGSDEMYDSYKFLQQRQPTIVYYTGFAAPFAELENMGTKTVQIPYQWLQQEVEGEELVQRLSGDVYLLVDREGYRQISDSLRPRLELLWDTNKGYAQYIFQAVAHEEAASN